MTATELLIKNDIRPSLIRLMILEYIRTHPVHPTVDDIYHALSPNAPTLSKTTVYNTVKLFTSKNIVKLITIEEQQARFDGCTDLHGHFYCNNCKKVFDFKTCDPVFDGLDGFELDTKDVYFTGKCCRCSEQ